MAELKRNFIKGRMNKDLDERLLPNGEYRHAENVEIINSEGDDMGSAQTTMGNMITQLVPVANATCVGSITDDKNDRLYWFIAGFEHDVIAEYDHSNGNIEPVCVDIWSTNSNERALNFNAGTLITGINIIDDMIFWTDGVSEPRKINITRGKAGSANWNTHTQFMTVNPWSLTGNLWNGGVPTRPIREEHLTVVKESPKTAPILEMKDTDRADIVGTTNRHFIDPNSGAPYDVDAANPPQVQLIINPTDIDYNTGDILILSTTNNDADDLEVRVKIDSVNGPGDFTVILLAVDSRVTTVDDLWDVELEQIDPLFHFKFPRFGYRYKYNDGEYSSFSPFTEVAFLPGYVGTGAGGKFEYFPKEGYNLSMVNNVRHLAVKDFIPENDILPDGVVSVDILYKESNSPNIYSVKTLDPTKTDWFSRRDLVTNTIISNSNYTHTRGYLKITSEMIHAVLPENQLLRPWDNVPRTAKAQEITGNRLVYGNYLQNYDIYTSSTSAPALTIDTWSKDVGDETPEQWFAEKAYSYGPSKSIKSLRTYQLGVVYRDRYGRETPVFSDDEDNNTSIYLDKKFAPKQTKLTARISSSTPPPDWAETFKFFIKETSNEYYNLAMDRWYDAKDENIWLSFPSSERNKVDIDTFLILKKAHDFNRFVPELGRYKILAIENEAPTFIKESIKSYGYLSNNAANTHFGDNAGVGFPLENGGFIWCDQLAFEDQGWDELLQEKTNLYLRFIAPTSLGITKSSWYPISNISLNKTSGTHYQLKVTEPFRDDMAFTSTANTYASRVSDLKLEIMERIVEHKPEFDGRFFVKIHKDLTLRENIIGKDDDPQYATVNARSISYINNQSTWTWSGDYEYIDADGDVRSSKAWDGWGTGSTNSFPSYSKRKRIEYVGPWHDDGRGREYWGDDAFMDQHCNNCGGFFIDEQNGFVEWITEKADNGELSDMAVLQALAPGRAIHFPRTWQPDDWRGNGNRAGFDRDNQLVPAGDDVRSKCSSCLEHRKVDYSQGIRRGETKIHLSYAGYGSNIRTDGGDWPSSNDNSGGSVNADNIRWWTRLDVWGNSYDDELLFLNTLMQPGTIWRWKEDPDQIVYKTYQQSGWPKVIYNYAQYKNAQEVGAGSSTSSSAKSLCCSEHQAPYVGNHYDYDYGKGWFEDMESTTSDRLYSGMLTREGRRWRNTFYARSLENNQPPGIEGPAGYLPTNPPNWVNGVPFGITEYDQNGTKVQVDLNPSTTSQHIKDNHPLYEIDNPTGGVIGAGNNAAQNTNTAYDRHPNQNLNNRFGWAPGVRHDGMMEGETASVGNGNTITIGDGTVTWEILEPIDPGHIKYASRNPGIWETEPKEDVGLDIYHEVGQAYPITLNAETNEQFIPIGSHVSLWRSSSSFWYTNHSTWHPTNGGYPGPDPTPRGTITPGTSGTWGTSLLVAACNDNTVTLVGNDASNTPFNHDENWPNEHIMVNDVLMFTRPDGSATEAAVTSTNQGSNIYTLSADIWNNKVRLPWFNCYSFGNGVESDRIRDDYNQVTIDNGPKASTTLEEPYLEEQRKNGLIYSGIYNSISGINNLNQFIQAEKITKDLNPTYGSIQKLFSRNTDLLTFCEDRVVKVLANKDALYNADGNPNLTATENVLGQTTPLAGDYGISTNPESFASQAYRAYFSDRSRGTVLRLSQDGLTPISDVGMKDWFSDNLRNNTGTIIGSFDDKKGSYNITLNKLTNEFPSGNITYPLGDRTTLSYVESAQGWTSFKSFLQESGLSLNNDYFTFFGGQLYIHNRNTLRGRFYDVNYNAKINIIINDSPDSVKSFNTLNYEGSQARITRRIDDLDFDNNFAALGWYVNRITTDLQSGSDLEFKDKEGKWFGQIKGDSTTLDNLDTSELSVQGIGNPSFIGNVIEGCMDPNALNYNPVANWHVASECEYPAWDCVCDPDTNETICMNVGSGNGQYASLTECLAADNDCSEDILGCMDFGGDPNYVGRPVGYVGPALNYNSTATIEDGSCIYCVNGCMDPNASNYDPLATCDDGSCCIDGCTDVTANNYNPLATCDDGSCNYDPTPDIYGCMDPLAFNYNPNATINQVSATDFSDPCIYCIHGCMDPNASNYNASATCDDGSCIYPPNVSWDCDGNCNCYDPGTGSGQYSHYTDCIAACCPPVPGCTDPAATNYNFNCSGTAVNATVDDGCCNYPPVPSWDCDNQGNCSDPGTGNGQYSSWNSCIINCPTPIYGCTDNTTVNGCGIGCNGAMNYSPTATIDDGSCIYCIYGCTDPLAINYNPLATCTDGSCIIPCCDCTGQVGLPSCEPTFTWEAFNDSGNCNNYVGDSRINWELDFGTSCFVANASSYTVQLYKDGNPLWNPLTFNTPQANGGWSALTPGNYFIRVVYSGFPLPGGQTCDWWYGSIEVLIGEPGEVFGCMDPTAVNYNPLAACPCDGNYLSMNPTNSPCVPGQTLSSFPLGCCCQYDTTSVYGCMDSGSMGQTWWDNNYTALTGIVNYPAVMASNYNPLATVDDGSCTWPPCICADPVLPSLPSSWGPSYTHQNGITYTPGDQYGMTAGGSSQGSSTSGQYASFLITNMATWTDFITTSNWNTFYSTGWATYPWNDASPIADVTGITLRSNVNHNQTGSYPTHGFVHEYNSSGILCKVDGLCVGEEYTLNIEYDAGWGSGNLVVGINDASGSTPLYNVMGNDGIDYAVLNGGSYGFHSFGPNYGTAGTITTTIVAAQENNNIIALDWHGQGDPGHNHTLPCSNPVSTYPAHGCSGSYEGFDDPVQPFKIKSVKLECTTRSNVNRKQLWQKY